MVSVAVVVVVVGGGGGGGEEEVCCIRTPPQHYPRLALRPLLSLPPSLSLPQMCEGGVPRLTLLVVGDCYAAGDFVAGW